MSTIENWKEIHAQLPKGVNLLAVSKGHSLESIQKLTELGQVDFGESRLQEAIPKLNGLIKFRKIQWHFVGHLQSNKVRGVVRNFNFIHSVDSQALAERISRIAVEEGRSLQIMLQVKLAEDPSKGGFNPEELKQKLPSIHNLSNLLPTGLMTIPPIDFCQDQRRNLFEECRSLANQLDLKDCSMGMSADWKEALQAGATWLRLGSCLFGSRQK